MEIRELQVNDVFVWVRILNKASKVLRAEIASAAMSNEIMVGISLVLAAGAESEAEVKAWLADLCGKEASEFGGMPPGVLLDICETLKGREDVRDFFVRLKRLLNWG